MSAPKPEAGSVVLSPADVAYLRERVATAIDLSLSSEVRREAAFNVVGRLEPLLGGGEPS